MKVNKLLPLFAIVIVLVVAVFVFMSSKDDGPTRAHAPVKPVKNIEVSEVDADSTTDTIRALTGQMELSQTAMERVAAEAVKDAEEKARILQESEKQIEEMQQAIADSQKEQEEQDRLQNQAITDQLKLMQQEIMELNKSSDQRFTNTESLINKGNTSDDLVSLSDFINDAEIPNGLGLDSLQAGDEINGIAVSDIVWINPIDRPHTKLDALDSDQNPLVPRSIDPTKVGNQQPTDKSRSNNEPAAAEPEPLEDIPLFTVPDLSMLTDSVGLTALVGRIYPDGDVTDPWPFKVMVGVENLTANYANLPPDLDGMLFEGYSVGDWTLGCVRGWLTASTFVFRDGTTISAYADSPGERPRVAKMNTSAIGYISDVYGNPCIAGEKLTDAPKYLAAQSLAAGIAGYATGLNAEFEQQSTTIDSNGTATTRTNVIAPTSEYARNKAYVGALQESSNWIRSRQQQSFDAVYAPPGIQMVVNLQTELRLDRKKKARQISHSNDDTGTYNASLD